MKTITAIRVLDHYRVWLCFDDGVEGTVDFSRHVGRGVFAPWADDAFFRQAALGERGRTLTWPGELDFCADALWLQVTGQPPENHTLLQIAAFAGQKCSRSSTPGASPAVVVNLVAAT
jgi:hypothetical protein